MKRFLNVKYLLWTKVVLVVVEVNPLQTSLLLVKALTFNALLIHKLYPCLTNFYKEILKCSVISLIKSVDLNYWLFKLYNLNTLKRKFTLFQRKQFLYEICEVTHKFITFEICCVLYKLHAHVRTILLNALTLSVLNTINKIMQQKKKKI